MRQRKVRVSLLTPSTMRLRSFASLFCQAFGGPFVHILMGRLHFRDYHVLHVPCERSRQVPTKYFVSYPRLTLFNAYSTHGFHDYRRSLSVQWVAGSGATQRIISTVLQGRIYLLPRASRCVIGHDVHYDATK